MESSTKEMGYHEMIQPYPDVNNFQYLDKSPQASIRAFPIREEKSARTDFQEKRLEVENWDEPTENAQQRPPRPTIFGILGSWTWELCSCVVATVALAGILAVLRKFEGRALKDWPYPVTINTLISILVTIARAALVIPLAEGISQLKWSWCRKKDQALGDLATFDEASRGAFGASKFVITKSPFQLASIASMLFLVSFAIGPFAQQVVEIGQRGISTRGTSYVPTCQGNYNDWESQGPAPGQVPLGFSTTGAVYDGILQNSSTTPVDVICPNGNCTFGIYQSLGFCSRCADISSHLVPRNVATRKVVSTTDCRKSKSCTYSLEQQGRILTGTMNTTVVNVTSSFPTLDPAEFANITPVVRTTAIYVEPSDGVIITGPAAAYECVLYFCVQQYDGRVEGGEFKEIPMKETSKIENADGIEPWSIANYSITPETCFHNGTEVSRTPASPHPAEDTRNCTYYIYVMNALALDYTIGPLLTGYTTKGSSSRLSYSSDMMHKIGKDTGNTIATIDGVFRTLAKRLTTHVRNVPNICQSIVPGTAWSTEPYIVVRWAWIILPAVVIGGTFLLLLAIIIRTWDEHVWKSSPLALVFLGMQDSRQSDGVTHPIFPTSPDIGSMRDSAKEIQVRLDGEGRWSIIGNR